MKTPDRPWRGMLRWNPKLGRMVRVKCSKKVVNAPAVHDDEIAPTMSMADSKMYTSKRALRASYKTPSERAPYGYIETGGEIPKEDIPEPSEAEIRDDAERSYYDIKYDRVPVSEKERALWAEEQRQADEYKRRNR